VWRRKGKTLRRKANQYFGSAKMVTYEKQSNTKVIFFLYNNLSYPKRSKAIHDPSKSSTAYPKSRPKAHEIGHHQLPERSARNRRAKNRIRKSKSITNLYEQPEKPSNFFAF
jgi:hypothetical protein